MMTIMTAVPQGVLYVATGAKYVAEVALSLRSLRDVHPTLPCALVTDRPGEAPPGFDVVTSLESPFFDCRDKVRGLMLTPFERTLFMDTDTHVCGPIDDAFPLLDRFELAARHEGGRTAYPSDACPEGFAEYNAGVILYRRSPRVMGFLASWLARYQEQMRRSQPPPHDAPSFRESLWQSDLQIYTLSSEYNFLAWIPQFMPGERQARILHGRRPDFPQVGSWINRCDRPRVFVPSLLFVHEGTLGVLTPRGRRLMRWVTALIRLVEPLVRRSRSPRAIDPYARPPRSTDG